MITVTEQDLIKSCFQGGNAKDKDSGGIKQDLEVIKEAAVQSKLKPEDRKAIVA